MSKSGRLSADMMVVTIRKVGVVCHWLKFDCIFIFNGFLLGYVDRYFESSLSISVLLIFAVSGVFAVYSCGGLVVYPMAIRGSVGSHCDTHLFVFPYSCAK